MISKSKISTNADSGFYRLLSDRSAQDFGYDLKQILQGCNRRIAFTNENVVATVAFVAFVAILASKENNMPIFLDYKNRVVQFASGTISWSDFVRIYWDLQRQLEISSTFADEMLTHIEGMSKQIMEFIPTLPGDHVRTLLDAALGR